MTHPTWSPDSQKFAELMELVKRDTSIKYVSWSLEGIRLTRKVNGERVMTELPHEDDPDAMLGKVAEHIQNHTTH